MTKTMAAESAEYGIRVNVIAPTVTRPPLAKQAIRDSETFADAVKTKYLLRGDLAEPEAPNWLGTKGLNNGVILLRWEHILGKTHAETVRHSLGRFKLSELETHPLAGIPEVDSKRRQANREGRAYGFEHAHRYRSAPNRRQAHR